MIKIVESYPPRKLSGLSSLLVYFKYNQEIINYLKEINPHYYHKEDFAWEIPINKLNQLLDRLVFFDELELKLATNQLNKTDQQLSESEIKTFKITPYKHQIEGINFGLNHKKFLLLDEMGAGKTNQIIWLAETLKRRKLIDHCLIICGVNALKQNWKKEIQKFSNESVLILGEKITKTGRPYYDSIKERAETIKKPINEFFIITNVETIRSEEIVKAINKSKNKFGMIAVDEIHKISSKNSQQGQSLLKLKADYLVGATGTPLVNSPLSCYLPLSWIGQEHGTLTNFKGQYCVFGGFNDSQIINYKNLDLLKEEITDCSIRRVKEELVDMPPKTVTTELIEMSDEHRKFYEAIKQGVKEEADKIELKTKNLLALTTRLRQATACPEILTTQPILSTKIQRCMELVEDLISQDEKVVIMSTFKEPVYQLQKLLAAYNPLIGTGDTSEVLLTENIDKFQNQSSYKLFIGTIAKIGTGLTLNSAAYMIFLDTPYTYASYSQAQDRIWRINNNRPAFIYTLVCKDTIDERIEQIVNTKKDLSDFIIDDVQNNISISMLKDIILGL